MSKGKYQVQPPPPFVLGVEGAGRVIEIAPDVHDVAVGDRVMTYAGQGCFAEQAMIPAQRVYRMPAAMTDDAASGFVLAYGTAYHSLVDCGELGPSQTVVVLGAAGGLGLCAVQIAKALGARVIAVASTADKRAKCIANGADDAIEADPAQLRERVRALTGGRGADVVFDIVGGDLTDPALRAIAPYGRFVVAGYASGQIPNIKANLILLKQAKVVGASYRSFAEHRPNDARTNMNLLCDMWQRGTLTPEIGAVLPFAEITSALRIVADRQAIGKVVVQLS